MQKRWLGHIYILGECDHKIRYENNYIFLNGRESRAYFSISERTKWKKSETFFCAAQFLDVCQTFSDPSWESYRSYDPWVSRWICETWYLWPCITLTYSEPLVYSELWYILKSKHIQNLAEYLRCSILLRTMCNYSRLRGPIYSKLSFAYSDPVCVSYSLIYQLFLELLTYCRIH